MVPENTLPKLNRYITTHDEAGRATFSEKIPYEAQWQHIPEAAFFLGYVTKGFPVDFAQNQDISLYSTYLNSPPGLTVSNGTVLRIVDLQPGETSPMHRTVSLDYGVVIEGEIELILDSGEKRLMKRGDVSVQRGTNHAWRNTSTTQWSRMLYVLIPSEAPIVAGKRLERA